MIGFLSLGDKFEFKSVDLLSTKEDNGFSHLDTEQQIKCILEARTVCGSILVLLNQIFLNESMGKCALKYYVILLI